MTQLQHVMVQLKVGGSHGILYLRVSATHFVETASETTVTEDELVNIIDAAHLDKRSVALYYGAPEERLMPEPHPTSAVH